MPSSLRWALVLSAWTTLLAGCDGCNPFDSCSGVLCGPCGPAITLQIDAPDATATAVSDASIDTLSCWTYGGTTSCQSDSVWGPGTHVYDVTALGRTERVTVVVERGPTGGCCNCGYVSATKLVTFGTDGGV